MARFSYEESENYKFSNNIFFSLKDDRDKAVVRFLINDIRDLYGVSCHEVKDGDKTFDVECLRAFNEPVDKCPLCAAGYKINNKLFIPLYNEDAKCSQIWVRGITYFDKMSALCARNKPLVGTPFEITRLGKSGDSKTTYDIYPGTPDNARVEDFPEINAEGSVFEVKNYDELNAFLDTGSFGENSRQRTQSTQPRQVERQIPMRRRPMNGEDSF